MVTSSRSPISTDVDGLIYQRWPAIPRNEHQQYGVDMMFTASLTTSFIALTSTVQTFHSSRCTSIYVGSREGCSSHISVEIPSGCVPFVLKSDKLRVETGDYPEQIIPIEKRPQWNA